MKVEVIDGFRVNTKTGEVLGVYEHVELTPPTQAEKDFYKYTSIAPKAATNKDQLLDYISQSVDKRKLVTFNNTRELHNMSAGESVRNKTKSVFTLPQYKTMNKIINNLTIANVLVDTKANIAKVLGCEQCNINRTLKSVENLIRVQTEGMQKGYMKILVHPAYGYKHQSDVINKLRIACVKDWIKPIEEHKDTQARLDNPVVVREIEPVVFSDKMNTYLAGLNKRTEATAKSYRKEELGIETEFKPSLQEALFIQDYYAGTKDSEYSR